MTANNHNHGDKFTSSTVFWLQKKKKKIKVELDNLFEKLEINKLALFKMSKLVNKCLNKIKI